MISFDQVQANAVALLTASADLAGVAVVQHLGRQSDEDALAAALDAKGAAISVLVPVEGRRVGTAAGTALIEADVPVCVEVNPERNDPAKNDAATGLSVFDLVKASVAAILRPTPKPDNENERFGLAEKPIVLDVLDSGLLRYQLTFTKRCVL